MLDTGAVTRGSGSKNEDKERNIRKWFVDHDLIDGVILLPENLFYNTNAAGVVDECFRSASPPHEDKVILLNASRRVQKGRPNCPRRGHSPLAATYLKGEPVDGELVVDVRRSRRPTTISAPAVGWN